MLFKSIPTQVIILCSILWSTSVFAKTPMSFRVSEAQPVTPVVVVQNIRPANHIYHYPTYQQPQATIAYHGSKAHIGVQFPIGQTVIQSAPVYYPHYPVQTIHSVPSHYQHTEQVSLPYGGTYTKKTEVIPQTPVYVQPQIVIPTQRVVIGQGYYTAK